MNSPRSPLRLAGSLVLLVAGPLAPPATAQALHPREYTLTMGPAQFTRPVVGNDGISDLIVYEMQVFAPDGSPAPADLWYQRVDLGGPQGYAVQVTADPTDDRFPDVDGDHIVYTAYDAVGSQRGRIVLYRISTRETWILGEADDLQAARIHDHHVVWIEGTAGGGTTLELYDLAWLGTPQTPHELAGPVPPLSNVDVDSRYVTWVEFFGGQYDVLAFDLDSFVKIPITTSSGFDDLLPVSSKGWIVWMSQAHGTGTASLEAFDPGTFEQRRIADDTFLNLWPSIDGDLVAYGSQQDGDVDLYLYRLSSGRTYRVTDHPAEQRLPRLRGDKLAHHDPRNGHDDVFLTVLDWAPVAHAGTDRAVTERAWVTLDGGASRDENGEALHFAWTQTDGPPVVLQDADGARPGFLAPEVDRGGATLAFELVVTAGAYASEPDRLVVSVQNLNRPPVAHAGKPQIVIEGGPPVRLDATRSYDPDGDPLSCAWVQVAGPPVVLQNAGGEQAWFTPPQVRPPGEELGFRLVVSDGDEKVEAFTTVTVRSPRRPKAR